MKKTILIIVTGILAACGGGEKKKKGFEYNRTKAEENKTVSQKGSTPIDLSNKGIGPIKNYSFSSEVNLELANEGKQVFNSKCTACHNVNRRLIGPAMAGIYERRSVEWVLNIMLNPDQMLKEDPIAIALLKEYNNILMLNQNLSENEAKSLAEYFRTL
jgi:cytochrome c5